MPETGYNSFASEAMKTHAVIVSHNIKPNRDTYPGTPVMINLHEIPCTQSRLM